MYFLKFIDINGNTTNYEQLHEDDDEIPLGKSPGFKNIYRPDIYPSSSTVEREVVASPVFPNF